MSRTFCQIVGFGPACTSFLVSADRNGLLTDLLQRGLVIHERRPSVEQLLFAGINYDIPSNSDASDFLDGISPDGIFAPVLDSMPARLIRARGSQSAPLQLVAMLSAELRRVFLAAAGRFSNFELRLGQMVREAVQTGSSWVMRFEDGSTVESRVAILSAGSTPHLPPELRRIAEQRGIPLLHSDTVLRPVDLGDLLPENARRITVIGASHSAFSVLHKLIEALPGRPLDLTLAHRTPIRRMHRSTDLAREAGETFDPVRDVCPSSGRVFRFQGLYTRSKLLYEQILAGRHPNITLARCADADDVTDIMRISDVVIAATGYRPNLPLFSDAAERPIRLGRNGSAVNVDASGHIADSQGRPLAGLLGIGLGFGRMRSDIGEPSYRGAPVGINIFQGPDGDALCDSIFSTLQQKAGEPLGKEYS